MPTASCPLLRGLASRGTLVFLGETPRPLPTPCRPEQAQTIWVPEVLGATPTLGCAPGRQGAHALRTPFADSQGYTVRGDLSCYIRRQRRQPWMPGAHSPGVTVVLPPDLPLPPARHGEFRLVIIYSAPASAQNTCRKCSVGKRVCLVREQGLKRD